MTHGITSWPGQHTLGGGGYVDLSGAKNAPLPAERPPYTPSSLLVEITRAATRTSLNEWRNGNANMINEWRNSNAFIRAIIAQYDKDFAANPRYAASIVNTSGV